MPYKYNPFTGTFDDTTPGTVAAAASGTAAAPGIYFSADSNTGIYNPSADNIAIATGGTGRLYVDASGRVGIGTSSSSKALSVVDDNSGGGILVTGSSSPRIQLNVPSGPNVVTTADSSAGYFGTITNHPLVFWSNDTERARIDSSGRLLVGTSTAVAGSSAKLQCSTTINLSSVATYADNTTATAGGLAVGDVYKTALGVLMIRY